MPWGDAVEFQQVVSCALEIGEYMLVSGAEVYRVEDCMQRICKAYGAKDVDVFTITSSIVLTAQAPDGAHITQTCRIARTNTDLTMVDALNDLSRSMCTDQLSYEEVRSRLEQIKAMPRYPQWVEYLMYAVIAGAFTLFFGGCWADMIAAIVVGVCLKACVWLTGRARFNQVFSNVIATYALTVLSYVLVRLGVGKSVDMIVIGNIMPLIPGIGLTNSLRDMVTGDTITGMLRFCEACIIALAIAAGYILASISLGGLGV